MVLGYIYLFLVILTGLTKGFCGKKTSGYTQKFKDAFFINAIRMIICVFIGFILTAIIDGFDAFILPFPAFINGILSGLFTAIFAVTWLISVKNSAYMFIDVILTFSTLIPIILSVIFFNESVHYFQVIGIILLIIAVIIMATYNNSVKKEKLNLKSIILLIICGLTQGLVHFTQKYYTNVFSNYSVYSFNFYTYLSSAIVLITLFFITDFKSKNISQNKIENTNFTQEKTANYYISLLKNIFVYVIIMAVCLFLHSIFATLASSILPSTLQYPMQQGLVLVLSLIMSAVFFKEKVTFKSVISIILTFIALIFINVLPSVI